MIVESHQSIDAAAGDWFARRESGEWTLEESTRFEQWLNESPHHRVAYLRIEYAWERAARLKALSTGEKRFVPLRGGWTLTPFFQGTRRRFGRREARSFWRPAAIAVAASLGLTVLGGPWALWPAPMVYRTPIGGIETVPLADGSALTLNTDSAVRLKFTSGERGVELLRGEAFFEVAKNPHRPFVVQAGHRRVIAIGTQFSVKRESGDDDVEVIVTEGTVRMEPSTARVSRAEATASSPSPSSGSGIVLLRAGSIAHASGTSVLVRETPISMAQESSSWRQGILIFHDLTLAQAAAEFNRYNAVQIVISDPNVAEMAVAGSFRATNVDAFVRLLERGYPVKSEAHDDQVVIEPR